MQRPKVREREKNRQGRALSAEDPSQSSGTARFRSMVLYLIGLGLADEKDITIKGLEAVKRCSKVYLEAYTSILGVSKEKLVWLFCS
jgi:hypothetical protein